MSKQISVSPEALAPAIPVARPADVISYEGDHRAGEDPRRLYVLPRDQYEARDVYLRPASCVCCRARLSVVTDHETGDRSVVECSWWDGDHHLDNGWDFGLSLDEEWREYVAEEARRAGSRGGR